jgi:hypothetical protein
MDPQVQRHCTYTSSARRRHELCVTSRSRVPGRSNPTSCGRAIGMAHAAWERRRDGFVRFDVGVGVGVGRAPGKSIAGPRPRPIGRQLARPGTVPTATSLWKPTATGRVRRVRDDGSASCVGPSSRSQPVARTWRRATCVVDGLHRCRAPIHRERADS